MIKCRFIVKWIIIHPLLYSSIISFVINESRMEKMINDSRKKKGGKFHWSTRQSKVKFRDSTVLMKWSARYFSRASILRLAERISRSNEQRSMMNRFTIVTVYFFSPGFYYFSLMQQIRQVRYDCSQLLKFFVKFFYTIRYI